MTKKKKYQLKSFVTLVLLIAAVCISANSSALASNNMLEMLPTDTLFAVKANNLDYALGRLDQFLAGALPIPMGSSMMLRMQLGQMFGSPELAGINTAGNFTIFGKVAGPAPQPQQAPPMFLAVAVPVTDYNKFIEGNPNCSQADSRKISKLVSTNKSMIQAGQFAIICISGTDDQLIETAKCLQSEDAKLTGKLDKTTKQNAAKEPFWAYCNMELINKHFGPMINTKYQESKSKMRMMASQDPQMANSAAMMDVYFQAFDFFLNESKFISATLSPSAESLNAQMIASALPETPLAEMFQTNTTPKENFAHYLNDGAMMNFIFNANPAMIKALNSFGFKMMTNTPKDGLDPEEIAAMTDSFTNNTSGPIAASITPPSKTGTFFDMLMVAKIKDVEMYQKDMEAMLELSEKGLFDSPGMNTSFKLNKNTNTYKNTKINSLKMVFKAQDPNSAEAQAIKTMFGDGLDAKYAFVNNYYLYTLAGKDTATINQLIDKTKSPSAPTSEEIKKAYALIPGSEKADMFATVNILRAMKFGMSFIPAPTPKPQMPDIQTTSNIVIAAKTNNGQMKFDVAVPKEHIKEIMTLIQTMQMQQMQQAQPAPASVN